MNKVSDFTKGSIPKLIISFYIPIFVTNILQQLYTFVDTVIVGNGLGDRSLAAVGNMNSLSFLIVGFSMGLAGGFTILLAQNFGAGDYAKLRKTFAASLQLIVIIGVVLTALSSIFLRKIMILIHTDANILEESLLYGHILFAVDFLFVYRNAVQGIGKPLCPMLSGIAEMVGRILVIALFIGKIGIKATAYAEGTAWIAALIINMTAYYVLMHKRLHSRVAS